MIKTTCKQCGQEFQLSDSEIEFYKQKGLMIPKRCKACRQKNKKGKGRSKVRNYEKSTDKKNDMNRNIDTKELGVKAAKDTSVPAYGKSGETSGNKKKKTRKSILVLAVLLVLVGIVLVGLYNKGYFGKSKKDAAIVSEYAQRLKEQVKVTDEPAWSTQDQKMLKKPPMKKIDNPMGRPDEPGKGMPEPGQKKGGPVFPYKFQSLDILKEQFSKYGVELGYETEMEYEQGANGVIANKDSLHKKVAKEGDSVYYLEATNEMVIMSTDGYIRTYFKSDDGGEYYESL